MGVKKNSQQKKTVQATTAGWDALLVVQPSITQPISSPIGNIPKEGCDLAWNLLRKLQEAADALESNTDISYASEGDELAGFSREAAISTYGMVENAEIWEAVNPTLDRILGFGRTKEEIRTIVRRGEQGLQGFCAFLRYLVEEKGVTAGLLDRKINTLLSAIDE
jgi:hypothetical protein